LQQIERRGVPVVLLGPSPEYAMPVPFNAVRFIETSDAGYIDSQPYLRPAFRDLDAKMQKLVARDPHIAYVSPAATACAGGRCPMMVGGTPVEFDASHLTLAGSRLFAQTIWPQVEAAARKR
jgi:hypothetical protein